MALILLRYTSRPCFPRSEAALLRFFEIVTMTLTILRCYAPNKFFFKYLFQRVIRDAPTERV